MIVHKEILNGFMSEMQHYIRHNETKTDWKFSSFVGLCTNLEVYAKTYISDIDVLISLESELRHIFRHHGFKSSNFPFNSDDGVSNGSYGYEIKNNLIYSNPLRLSFIENWKPL